jgi:hypothetical protein
MRGYIVPMLRVLVNAVSTSPDGEQFPIPAPEAYPAEFERVKRLVEKMTHYITIIAIIKQHMVSYVSTTRDSGTMIYRLSFLMKCS